MSSKRKTLAVHDRILDRIDRVGEIDDRSIDIDTVKHRIAEGIMHEKLRQVALISTNLQDATGIETVVEEIQPISKREHEIERARRSHAARSRIVRDKDGRLRRLFRRVPGIEQRELFAMGEYMMTDSSFPHDHPLEVPVALHEAKRSARGLVLPFFTGGDLVSRRRPRSPDPHRANDLIIELPDLKYNPLTRRHEIQGRVKSWHGGKVPAYMTPNPGWTTEDLSHLELTEAKRADPKIRTFPKPPLAIGVGDQPKGTFFTPGEHHGFSSAAYKDQAIEGLTSVKVVNGEHVNPDGITAKTAKVISIIKGLTLFENKMLEQIARENDIPPEDPRAENHVHPPTNTIDVV